MGSLATTRGLPESSSPKDISEASYKTVIVDVDGALARHDHVVKLKVDRARYLLWRRTILLKKLSQIELEIGSMLQEDL